MDIPLGFEVRRIYGSNENLNQLLDMTDFGRVRYDGLRYRDNGPGRPQTSAIVREITYSDKEALSEQDFEADSSLYVHVPSCRGSILFLGNRNNFPLAYQNTDGEFVLLQVPEESDLERVVEDVKVA